MMDKNKMPWRGFALRGALALTLSGLAGGALADEATPASATIPSTEAANTSTDAASGNRWGIQLGAGIANHDMKKFDLGIVWDPHLNWWYFGGFHFTAVVEGHAALWHSTASNNVNGNIGEFGIEPVIRIIKDSGAIRPYIEAGAGVRVLTHPRITSTYTVSTAFQFADIVGVGAEFGGHQQYLAGLRLEHVSNASIKDPNPGINFTQLYLQYNF
ncbi:acyloxyacyl hydrolase [Paraburkholderia phosphatilytica]|uniref:acyloxyacyl hydrolase n=1 Tax=Paraburkholderia phosphatilytica TaxID=2282883 RepID=UPI001F0C901B|nr:acyloxyacyl hydrolase [Paraburkholderia phosphatilytica]